MESGATSGESSIIISDKQFGIKAGKHAHEFGLDVHTAEGRIKLRSIIEDIYCTPDEIRIGQWHRYGEVLFYIKGNDVVLATKSNDFITIMKGGIANARVKNARIREERTLFCFSSD